MTWSVPKIGAFATPVASGDLTLAEPAGTAEGDLQIACFAIRSTVGFTNADWSKIEGQLTGDTDATNGIASGEMWYRVRGAAAGTLTWSRTGGDLGAGRIIAYTGGKQNATAVLGNHSSNTLGAASGTNTTGTISTVEANELIVAMSSAGDNLTATAFDAATDPTTASGATDTTTAPTAGTWIERSDDGTNTGADGGLAIADAVRATAGATGTIQTTVSASARHVMIASAFRQLVDTAVACGVGALLATGFAPAVTAGANTTVTAGVGEAVVTGFAPTVTATNHQTVSAGFGELTATGFAPTILVGTVVTADVGALTLSGLAPTVTASDHQTVMAGLGELTATAFAPTVTATAHVTASAGHGEALLSGFTPTVTATAHVVAATALGELAATGFVPTVTTTAHQFIATDFGVALLTGFAPSAEVSGGATEVQTETGIATLTGLAPVVTASDHQTVGAGFGILTLTGFAPSVDIAIREVVQYSLTNLSSPAWTISDVSCPMYRCTSLSAPSFTCEVPVSQIDCAVDYEAAVYIERPRLATAATGLSGVTLRISATRGGAAIHASLSGTATEDPDNLGTYVYTFDVADLQTHLTTYANQHVFLVVEKSGDISTKSFALPVVAA